MDKLHRMSLPSKYSSWRRNHLELKKIESLAQQVEAESRYKYIEAMDRQVYSSQLKLLYSELHQDLKETKDDNAVDQIHKIKDAMQAVK